MRDTITAVRLVKNSAQLAIVLTFDFQESGEQWTAECLETGTAAYAGSLEQARRELMEAVSLQLSEVDALGHIREFLHERGVKVFRLTQGALTLDKAEGAAWRLPEAVAA